jgi:hypothetical protein
VSAERDPSASSAAGNPARPEPVNGGRGDLDAQQVELIGTALLTSMLLRDGIEVADPRRDRGVDLIAYLERSGEFYAAPIQVKAYFDARLTIDRKYSTIADIRIVHVWHVRQDRPARAFCMTFPQAEHVATTLGWTATNSWTKSTKSGGYSSNVNLTGRGGQRILDAITPFEVHRGTWKQHLFGVDAGEPRAEPDPPT